MGEPRNGGLVDFALDDWKLGNYILWNCKLVWLDGYMGEPGNGDQL